MSLSVGVNIKGDEQFMRKLRGLGDIEKLDFHEALETIGKGMTEYYANQGFLSQGGSFGMPWAKLAPSTQAFKSAHYRQYAAMPLMASGAMRGSFASKASARKLVISNSAPYFKYHQSSAPRQKLPRRVMFGVNTPIKAIIKTIILADMETKIAKL